MLYTNLNHIENARQYEQVVGQHENVVICAGRMDSPSVTMYRQLEEMELRWPGVAFFDMEFDNPESKVLQNVADYCNIKNLPWIGLFKNGSLMLAFIGVQNSALLQQAIDKVLVNTK